jgi:hypothetical protein
MHKKKETCADMLLPVLAIDFAVPPSRLRHAENAASETLAFSNLLLP